jgi:hypothetical protein
MPTAVKRFNGIPFSLNSAASVRARAWVSARLLLNACFFSFCFGGDYVSVDLMRIRSRFCFRYARTSFISSATLCLSVKAAERGSKSFSEAKVNTRGTIGWIDFETVQGSTDSN